jgi:hypothetical protein
MDTLVSMSSFRTAFLYRLQNGHLFSILTLLRNPVFVNIVTCISDLYTGFGLVNQYIGYSQVVGTSNYNTLKDYCNCNTENKVFCICFK